jgi:pilus assembly protein FimV
VKNKFHPLKSGEVICVANPVQFVSPHNTFRVSELADALKQELIKYSGYGVCEEDLGWLSPEGSDCAVLKFGAPGWQKGKLRLKIEFCPDDSESGYTADDDEEDETEANLSPQTQAKSLPSPATQDNDLDSVFDDFSNDPDLDFIAESATVLEFSKPNYQESLIKQTSASADLDADLLSQSIEQELNAEAESEEDPFADEDNFGFGELGLDDDDEDNSDLDSVWQDL